MVDVAVRVQQPGHRPLAAMLAVERQRRRRALRGDQRVDHEHARVALDDRHALDRGQPALAPEARGGVVVGTVAGEEVVGVRVPDHAAVGRLDPSGVERGDEAAARVLEVLVALGHAAPSS